jgi:glutamate formiminotransferase/formiminotetrahydrofolate cyclodeaminase
MFGLRGQCEAIRGRLEALVAEDSRSYEAVLQARKLPSGNELEASRKASLELEALWGATRVPLETAQVAAQLIPLAGILATRGNYNARSDAGVALLLAQAAVRGALLNVGINLPDLPEGAEKNEVRAEAARLKLVLRGADDILKSLESELA